MPKNTDNNQSVYQMVFEMLRNPPHNINFKVNKTVK